MTDVKLTIFSDYICPWCYVGQALATRLQKEFNIEIVWWPYELHPGLPPEGQPREPRPGPSRPQQMAQEEGLLMVQPAITANSKLAQEATEFARALGKGNDFHHAMFATYWQKGLNISLESVILDVAREVGLDTKRLQTALREGAYRDALEEKLESARQSSIQVVPSFLINEKFLIEGVYPYDMFARVIKQRVFGQPASGLQVIGKKEASPASRRAPSAHTSRHAGGTPRHACLLLHSQRKRTRAPAIPFAAPRLQRSWPASQTASPAPHHLS